jgi:cobalt/nickel transport system permease protein
VTVRRFCILAVVVAVAVGTLASPFASASPDGLEKVAERQAFLDRATTQRAPIPDYGGGGRLATGAAGFIGTLLTLGAAVAVVRISRRR